MWFYWRALVKSDVIGLMRFRRKSLKSCWLASSRDDVDDKRVENDFMLANCSANIVEQASLYILISSSKSWSRVFNFFNWTELIEPVLPQEAQLGIHFFIHNATVRDRPRGTWLRTLHWWRLLGIDRRRRNNPAPSGIWSRDLVTMKCVLYHCATSYNCNLNAASYFY